MKKQLRNGITGLVLMVLLAGCAAGATPPTVADTPAAPVVVNSVPTIVRPDGLGPIGVVTEFYRWYLAYINSGVDGPRNPVVSGAYCETGYVTSELADRISASAADARGGFDPFLCAQDVPSEVLPVEVRDGGSGAAVDVRTSFEGHQFTVVLAQTGAGWRIQDIVCGGAKNQATPTPQTVTATAQPLAEPDAVRKPTLPGGWQVYRNEAYRFQVGYPQGWVARETAAVEGQPPIGPENTKLVVMLMPQAWAEQLDGGGAPDANAPVLAPLTVEVTVGGEEEFWSNYPELTRTEVRLTNATAVQAVEKVSDVISIPHLIYQHPVAKELRVALTDPISGFADRKAAYPDVAAAFEEVANSFAWLD